MDRRNILQGLIAFSALAVGVLVYVFDRPGGSAVLLPAAWSSGDHHRVFGFFGGQIPDFSHVYAFSLLTALALGSSRRAALLSCGLWLAIDGLFEIAQRPAINSTLPVTFQHLRGTFDPWDLTALALGAAVAFFTIRTINADYRDAVALHTQPLGRNTVMISLVCVGLLTILGSEVGGGEEGGDGSGGGFLMQIFINVPPADIAVNTSSADLSGIASCPDCPPGETAFGYCPVLPPFIPDTAVTVSWTNQTSGATGLAFSGISGSCSCLFSYCTFLYNRRWSATVPLVLGANAIQVSASGSLGTGSDSVTITRVPLAPTNVTATSQHGQVTIAWDNVADATSYNIYWSDSRFLTTATGTVITNVTSPYTHTGLSDDVPYYYLITAVNNGTESFGSSVVWATPGWSTEPVADTAATTTQRDASIAVDSGDHVHLHYSYDEHVGNAAYQYNVYATNAAGTWTSTPVANPSDVNANIALDSTGAVHVSYLDFSGLTHAVYGPGVWTTEVADAQAECDASLAIDSTDKIHLAYRANASFRDELRYASNASGTWASHVVEAFDPSGCDLSGRRVAVAVDSTGAAHIAYAGAPPAQGLKYATNQGGSWTVVVLDQGHIGQVSAAVDGNGKIHIVYVDFAGRLRHAHNTLGTWTVEDIASTGSHPSLVLDAAGNAHVSYFYQGTGDLRYAHTVSGAWHVVPVADVGATQFTSASDTAIAVDSQGKVHIGYFDNRTGSLRHATNR